jgi:hypothetical protein
MMNRREFTPETWDNLPAFIGDVKPIGVITRQMRELQSMNILDCSEGTVKFTEYGKVWFRFSTSDRAHRHILVRPYLWPHLTRVKEALWGNPLIGEPGSQLCIDEENGTLYFSLQYGTDVAFKAALYFETTSIALDVVKSSSIRPGIWPIERFEQRAAASDSGDGAK